MKRDITIIGYFAFLKENVVGASVKTREIEKILKYKYRNVCSYDTVGWKSHPFQIVKYIIEGLKNSKNLIFIIGGSSFHRILPFLIMVNRIYNCKIHFIAIGAYSANEIKNKHLYNMLKKVYKIYVESSDMKKSLIQKKLNNVEVLYNFKTLSMISEEWLKTYKVHKPYKYCYFARVSEKKGILDAIKVFSEVNRRNEKIVCSLDIYGKVEEGFENEFYNALIGKEKFISYKGIAEAEKSTDILKNYYMLVFPTKFYAEGFPGTILDALSAGLPTLSSRYPYYGNILDEGITAISYEYKNIDDFYAKLVWTISHSQIIIDMKENCLYEYQKYLPDNAIKVLEKNL